MSRYMEQFNGSLRGLMRWPQWDALRDQLDARRAEGWYVYFVGEEVPTRPFSQDDFGRFLKELDTLLRHDHREDYFGIAYSDDVSDPSFIKVYDPNNLGASCGSSGHRVLPGWTISLEPPVDLRAQFPNPGNRRRWWRSLFG